MSGGSTDLGGPSHVNSTPGLGTGQLGTFLLSALTSSFQGLVDTKLDSNFCILRPQLPSVSQASSAEDATSVPHEDKPWVSQTLPSLRVYY